MIIKLLKISVMFGMILSTGSFATRNEGSIPKRPKFVEKQFLNYEDCIESQFRANPGSKKSDFNLVCNDRYPIK